MVPVARSRLSIAVVIWPAPLAQPAVRAPPAVARREGAGVVERGRPRVAATAAAGERRGSDGAGEAHDKNAPRHETPSNCRAAEGRNRQIELSPPVMWSAD